MTFSRLFCAVLVVAGSLGLFLGTPNPVFHVPGAVLVYPACLFLAAESGIPFRLGWCVGIPGAAAALYWIAVAAHMYGAFPWLLAAPCSLLLGTYVALWGGLFCLCASRLSGLSPWRRIPALGLVWFLLEWTRGWFCTGFSWLTLSSGLAAWPLLVQPLSLVGEYGYSGMLAVLAFLFCEGFLLLAGKQQRRAAAFLAGGACLAALIVAFGAWRLSSLPEKLAAEGRPVVCTMVQGSVRQDVKWSPEYQRQTLEHYIRLSVEGVRADIQGLAGSGRGPGREELAASMGLSLGKKPDGTLAPALPDLIIWPETAMPFAYPSSPLAGELRTFVRELGLPLMFGAPGVERSAGGTELFNRAFLLLPGGDAGHYDKEHLVPFGEYLPPVLDWKIFESLLQGLGGFTAGTGEKLFSLDLKERGRADVGMLICYEAIFPELSRKRVASGAELLLNISNDAWYDYTSAPMQHLQLSLMRAVEQGRYVLRATNSGITAVLDPLGGVHAMGSAQDGYALFLAGSLTGTALALQGHTPYFYLHPWLPALALAFLFVLVLPALRGGRGKEARCGR